MNAPSVCKIRKFLMADVRILSVLDPSILFQNVVTSPIVEISWSWIVCNNARHRNIRSRGQAHRKRNVPLTAGKEYTVWDKHNRISRYNRWHNILS
jgi:hypothetical protein